ncbi:ABC transporter ATP-binding protein [Methylococcus capsulatus]|nr:ABC transporter ATP-binding protein [Methylococcus capsulatus]QXP86884.1 ABC transporter ATP-binding protein [Methylococcus capsulatus]QXP93436.1 ABC transporter ATP-binding protein [Methylococcus capsulatus]UQN11866.1 ABC transporter ATP-binding protein [Methylococcus capsulatus]
MTAILLHNVAKSYRSYDHPWETLWEVFTKTRRHREWTALHPLSLEIAHGEVVGIVGTNGAGKSTLLKLIAGTLTPSAGDIRVNGHVAALLELGAGFHPDMTGRENVYLGASVMGLSSERVDRLYDGIVEFAGLGEFMDQPVKTYSSGMYMRLAFAVATAADPDVLILDEALSVGDGAFARKSFERIIGYKDAGKTILFCSHSLYQVEAICSRVLWLDHGRLVMDGEPARVVSAYAEFLGGGGEGCGTPDQPAPAAVAGSGVGRLTKVEVEADGVEGRKLTVRSGQTDLTVAVGFASDPALPPPSVGLTITGSNGWAVASASTSNDGLTISRRPDGSGEVELSFPRFPLLKGAYWVNVFLLCEQGIHLYDRIEHAAELEVVQDGLEQGVVSLPRRWSVNGAPASAVSPTVPTVAAR